MSKCDDEPTWPKGLEGKVVVPVSDFEDEEPTTPTNFTQLLRAVEMLPVCKCGRYGLGCAQGCEKAA